MFMKGLCKRAGVKPLGFHALRRYCASVLADTHKVSSKVIQGVLRHKHLATAERYVQRINTDLTSVMALLGDKGLPSGLPKDGHEVENCEKMAVISWQSQGESNPCLRRERAMS